MARASQAEIARRIQEIRSLVVECASLREIRTATIKHTSWGAQISLAQLKRYIAAAREQIKEAANVDLALEIGAAKLRCERTYAKAVVAGDLHTALAANRQLIELLGLAAPRRSEVAHSGHIDLAAARSTLEQELAALIAEGRYGDGQAAEGNQ
jgi:hypothetical protein